LANVCVVEVRLARVREERQPRHADTGPGDLPQQLDSSSLTAFMRGVRMISMAPTRVVQAADDADDSSAAGVTSTRAGGPVADVVARGSRREAEGGRPPWLAQQPRIVAISASVAARLERGLAHHVVPQAA